MAKPVQPILNAAEAPEHTRLIGDHQGGYYKPLTPSMKARGGSLGVNLMRVPPGRAAVPFHAHQLEDEVFYVLEGAGVLRYGDQVLPLSPGDCVSCPAGSGLAHQIANTGDVDLLYLSIGTNDTNEVCSYPDSGKILVRALGRIGFMQDAEYMDGEPARPKVFDLVEAKA